MSEDKLIENYGNPRLIWGYYPLSADYNSGGCIGGCGVPLSADPLDIARAAERKLGMEQRGGNNPFDFQEQQAYTQHEVGTGCYNTNCKCNNCHGDCLCDNNGAIIANNGLGPIVASPNTNTYDDQNDALTWLGMIALAYFIYKLLFKRKR